MSCLLGAITPYLAPLGSITCFIPAMANSYVINALQITGLNGGTTDKLDGISAASLASMPNGTLLAVAFTGEILAYYKLEDLGVGSESAPWKIVFDQVPTRCAVLQSVWKQGAPCLWNADTSKWHQILAGGTGAAVFAGLAAESDAFSLPA